MNKFNSMEVPREEVLHPQTTLFVEDIESSLPKEELGVLTESGRINKQGREIAERVYQEFLSRSSGDYKQILEICKQAESLLDTKDPDTRDLEMVRIIQSVRGKVVYNAHRTWVEKQIVLEDKNNVSASSIMRYAKELRTEAQLDVYEAATNIERERAEINAALATKLQKLEEENGQILQEDIQQEAMAKGLAQKLNNFVRGILPPQRRRKLVAGALVALFAVTTINGILALRTNSPSNAEIQRMLHQPQVAQVLELDDPVGEIVVSDIPFEEDYLLSSSEVPDIIDDLAGLELGEGDITLEDEPETAMYENESTGDISEILTEAQSALDVDEDVAEVPQEVNPTNEIIESVLQQEAFTGILNYERDYAPNDLVNLADETYGVVTLGHRVEISERALGSVLGFVYEASEMGYTIGIAYGYRDYDLQEKLHNDNPLGAAKPGGSHHQSGFAVDLYLLDYGTKDWSTMKSIPRELIPVAKRWGLIRPFAWDPPHFVVIDAISSDLGHMLQERGLELNPSDPLNSETGFALNEILMRLSQEETIQAMLHEIQGVKTSVN